MIYHARGSCKTAVQVYIYNIYIYMSLYIYIYTSGFADFDSLVPSILQRQQQTDRMITLPLVHIVHKLPPLDTDCSPDAVG